MLHHRLRIQSGITDTVRYQHLLGLVFPSSQEFHRVSSSFSIRVLSIREVSPEGISIILVHLSGHWLKTPYISGTVLVPSRCPFSTQTLSGSSDPIIRCSSYCYLLHTPITNACSLLTTASLSSFKVFFSSSQSLASIIPARSKPLNESREPLVASGLSLLRPPSMR